MPALLLVSENAQLGDDVEQAASKHSFRCRTVASVEAAEEWLSMQDFEMLLVDAEVGEAQAVLDLLVLAWKHSPMLLGGVISLREPFSEALRLRLLGGTLYSGSNGLKQLHELLAAMPGALSLGEGSHYAILVVEDLDSPRDIICAYIESLGYKTVKGVASAALAIEELEKHPYEYFCVITDLQMPEMNGIELIRRIRADSTLRSLPVVALTSTPSSDNLVECLKAGVSGFLSKPPKKLRLQKELERAKRLILSKEPASLCEPEDAERIEEELRLAGQLG